MVEALLRSHKETEQGRKKPFTLRTTNRFVGPKRGKETKQFPHFRVPLSAGEERIIGNFSLIVESCCPKTRSSKISIGQICENGGGLSIDDVYQKRNVLKIGDIAEIVLRRFRIDGRPVFHFAVARDIKVSSRERLHQQIAPIIAAS